jgi:hypothetical protein
MISITQGIVGGFAAVEGITAMVGEGNEDLQKTMVKLQGAMSALAGIQAVANTLNKTSAAYTTANTIATNVSTFAQKRYAAAVGTTTGAMRLLRIAGAALGIGLIIGAIALLVANFDKLKNVVGKFIPSLDTITKGFKAAYNAVTDFLGITNDQTRAADKLKESSDKLLKSQQDELEVLKASGATKRELYLAEYDMMATRIATLDKMAKLNKKYSTEEAAERAELIQSIKVLNAEYRKEESDSDKQKGKESKEAQTKANEAARVKREEALKQRIKQDQQALKDREQNAKNEKELIEGLEEDDKAAEDKKIEEGKAADAYNLQVKIDSYKLHKDIDAKALEDKKSYKDQILAIEQSIVDSQIGIAQQAGQFLNQVAGDNKNISLAALAIEKGAAIASIIINTQREIAGYYVAASARSALTAGTTTAFDQALAAKQSIFAKVRAGIGIASIGAAGLNGAKQISGGGGSAGGGGGGSISSQPPRLDTFQSNRPAMNPNQRVYVLEKDITDSQGRVARIRHNATLI